MVDNSGAQTTPFCTVRRQELIHDVTVRPRHVIAGAEVSLETARAL